MQVPYLFVFAQVHEDFRIPELLSVAELHDFEIAVADPEKIDLVAGEIDVLPLKNIPRSAYKNLVTEPFMVLYLDSEEHARTLARRCILVKSVCEHYGSGATYEQVHAQTRACRAQWSPYADRSFKFLVTAYNHTIPQSRQRQIIESFAYMEMQGHIDMKNPDVTFVCYEQYVDRRGTTRTKEEGDGRFTKVFFGRLIEEGTARLLVKKFDVKKRAYYGNTSMEAEISLLMANQTLAAPGKLIYDPFMGTGSMAYTTAHFGALVYGSDIDGRQMRGKGTATQPGIRRAASQYGVDQRIVDLCTFDVTHNPWRCGELFDAIVTDPPYGVRAGAKRLGRKNRPTSDPETASSQKVFTARPDDTQPYIPPTKPYELSALARDLVLLARYLLKPRGRLVMFIPTVTEDYHELDVQLMLCDGMEVVANSLQDFGSWGRRLITIRKVTTSKYPPPSFAEVEEESAPPEEDVHVPAHKDFREKYFQGFKKSEMASDDSKDV